MAKLTPARPRRLRSAGRWLLGLALGLGTVLRAPAQIMPAKPHRLDAANRRAQRQARRTPTPYLETHLDIARTRLRRGNGDQPHPDGADALRYRHGAPVAHKNGFLRLGRKKK